MKEPDITDLFRKIKEMQLNDAQRELMKAIIAVAQDLTEVEVGGSSLHFVEEFDASFTPHHADLVIEYAQATSKRYMVSENAAGTHPAMVSHMVSRDHPTP